MKLLVVDYLNTIIRSLAVNKDLSSGELSTGGVYGFITQLSHYINKYEPDSILVCKDKRPYLRELDFPNYKINRKKSGDEVNDFFQKLNENCKLVDDFLNLLNISVWSEPGFEADDLIASCIKKHNKDFDKIYILCNDNDLYQLLSYENVKIIKKDSLYGKKEMYEDEKHPGATPELWVEITSLSGTHNNVPGIEKVGLKTALKILNNPEKLKKVMEEHFELINRNRKLIQLPYKQIDTIPISKIKVNESVLIKFLLSIEIQYTNRMHQAFSKY